MTCRTILLPPPARLSPKDTVSGAIATLLSLKVAALPVVDEADRYVGTFGLKEIIGQVMPASARLNQELGDLAYISDSAADLSKRLASHGGETIGKLVSHEPTVRPETSLMEALLLLYRGQPLVAVVDDAGKFAGILTAASAASKLAEGV